MKKLEGKPFALIGVNSDRDRDGLKPTLAKEQITWRSFWNGAGGTNGPISKAWSIQGWPALYLIDQNGIIRKHWGGSPNDPFQLDREIDALLREMEGKKT